MPNKMIPEILRQAFDGHFPGYSRELRQEIVETVTGFKIIQQFWKGTPVPRKQGIPPRISGSRTMTEAAMLCTSAHIVRHSRPSGIDGAGLR